jgi:hypothetical protein
MQIHEITESRVDEGLWNKGMALANYYAGDYAKSAEYSQKELQSQGQDPELDADPKQSWEQKYTDLKKTPGMTVYINGLAQEWLKSPDAKVAPATATSTTRAAPGQMSAAVAASKTGQNMQQMFGQPKGGIQDMQSDLEEAIPMDPAKLAKMKQRARTVAPTTTTTAAAPTTTATTTAAAPAPADYIGKFQAWADEKLATRVQGVYGASATMDDVRKDIPELVKKLDQALRQVANTQGTAQHVAAIQEYLKLASAGIQAIGQQKRYDATKAKYKPGADSDAINQLGLTDRQTQGLKSLARTPAGKTQILKVLGMI